MKKLIMLLAGCLALFSGTSASAYSLTTTAATDGTLWDVNNVAAWATTGNKMDGISVTAFFSDGSSQEQAWADNTGVVGTGWSLTMSDYETNTWWSYANWNLTNDGSKSMTGLVIEGQPGNTVFDILYWPETTPGSAAGRSIIQGTNTATGVDNLTVTAAYSNMVGVNGAPAQGDLYRTLTLSFVDTGNTFFGAGTFSFTLDTDNVNDPGEVPEPATMILFGFGLVGLIGLKKHQNN